MSGSSATTEMRGSGRRGMAVVALLSLLVGLAAAVLEWSGAFENLDTEGYDMLVKWQKKAPPSKNIVFVDFDEATVTAYHAFPLPRTLVADVVSEVSLGNPTVIGLDVLLDAPRQEEEDAKLEKAINDAGKVVIASEDGFRNHPPSNPLPQFENAAANVAYADLVLDKDDSVRRMFLRPEKGRFPFAVALATYYSQNHLRSGQRGYYLFGKNRIHLATAEPPTAWIHFHPSPPVNTISAEEILKKQADLTLLEGKIVMIGQSSEKGRDLVPTPTTRGGAVIGQRSQLSGTEVLAAATETLLSGDALRPMGVYPRWAIGLLLGFLVAACGYWNRWFVSVGVCGILVAGIFGCALYLFITRHLWMPFAALEFCLFLALPAGLGYRSVEERRLKRMMEAERSQLMALFERYVSPDVAAEIWKRRQEIVLAGEEREATILFSDIRSFTAMTCGVPSHEVLAWLNRYLGVMAEVIKSNRGFLNKFIGDGIMVVFGVPLSEGAKPDACRAVQCALEMLARVEEWNANLPAGEQELRIGIGIHTGQVTAGNVGSPDRMEYSVIGEAVNLASRLEAQTKDFHVPIVISPVTWEKVRDEFSTRNLGEAQIRGFAQAIPVYSVEAKSTVEVRP